MQQHSLVYISAIQVVDLFTIAAVIYTKMSVTLLSFYSSDHTVCNSQSVYSDSDFSECKP